MARLLLSLLRTQATLHTPCPVQKFGSSLRPCLIAKHVALPTILPCYFLVYQAASASRKMVSHRILDDLRSAAQQEEAPFYCGGYIEPSEELSVVFQEQKADGPSLAKLSFPFDSQHSATLDRLVKACSAQITPGQVSADGSQDTALHLDAAKFTTSFEPAEDNVLEDVRRISAPVGVTHVRLKRERLILCPMGSSAELGQAIEHGQETSFGKLALVLPLSHTGGEIVVRHNLSTKPFSWEDGTGKGGKKSIQWLAFLNKCSADVEEVTRGCVIAILYQLLPTYASKRTTVVERSVDHYSRSRSFRSFLTLSNVPADFFCGGSFIPADPIAIQYWSDPNNSNLKELQLPPPAATDLQQLIDACSAAPFGKEGVVEAVHDSSYRKALKLDRNSFKISPGSCKDEEKRIVEEIMKVLVPNAEGVTAELYKLNVYGPGDFFKPHVDTPRGEGMFGSLVICLPVPHTGGDLVVRHNGKSHTFSTGGGLSDSAVNWAAFFSDCEHEVTPVTRGHRITLTYNLYGTQREAALDLNLELNLKTVDPTSGVPNFLHSQG